MSLEVLDSSFVNVGINSCGMDWKSCARSFNEETGTSGEVSLISTPFDSETKDMRHIYTSSNGAGFCTLDKV